MKVYVALAIIALIGFSSILALSLGIFYLARSGLERLIGIALIFIGVVLLVVWERSLRYFGYRSSCFSR